MSKQNQHLAIFASGTGSNARQIVKYFEQHPSISVALIISNKASAPVLEMARQAGIDTLVIDRPFFYESEDILKKLAAYPVDLLVLAGFLWLIPGYLVQAYPNRIVNVHPALLPKYGGKGMYGMHVHRAVKAAGEAESGMTIHFVNEHYDEGAVIFQARCALSPKDDAEQIAAKVLALEHHHFAPVIEQVLAK